MKKNNTILDASLTSVNLKSYKKYFLLGGKQYTYNI